MRILAIGLGGAGCRIVNSLYTSDRRSSKVECVQALAIDVHADSLAQLSGMPENTKLFFPPLDIDIRTEEMEDTQTATIDIGEIVSRIHDIDSKETDALFMCFGLGGSMVDVAPHIIGALRSSVLEPIFGLVTLPCLAEGERHSAKAADDLEMLSPLLDGIILFDNETWYKKIKAQKSTLNNKKEKGIAEILGFGKREPEISPQLATYELLNEAIVRRISLILRAGEFKADGGLDFAEVVLDSGEVLNTMKGMGYITIGYAVERLPHHPLKFLTALRPTGLFTDSHTIKASRIVDLAKQAIYHEISTPCDMTSAHKALILIAGPSHELSLKGYMTVRKWIDRSIAGLETRSGDYPVMNTKNVAIIIMLSGLENIPRITELKEIQKQYKTHLQESDARSTQKESDAFGVYEGLPIGSESLGALAGREKGTSKDEVLILSETSYKKEKSSWRDSVRISHQEEEIGHELEAPAEVKPPRPALRRKISSEPGTAEKKTFPHPITKPHIIEEAIPPLSADEAAMQKVPGSQISRHRVVVAEDQAHQTRKPAPVKPSTGISVHELAKIKKSSYGTDTRGLDEKHAPHSKNDRLKTKEMERQIIEKELQRQRMKAISGRTQKAETVVPTPPPAREVIRLKRSVSDKSAQIEEHEPSDTAEVDQQSPKKRTVIIQKKKLNPDSKGTHKPELENKGVDVTDEDTSIIIYREKNVRQAGSEEAKVGIKHSVYKTNDAVFEGKSIQKTETRHVRNSALGHTDLKSKKSHGEPKIAESEMENTDQATESPRPSRRKEKKKYKKDDISWI
ncbi:MAG: tubulin/FtsZ family protein [Methanoregula sp.]|nr:tubulin/FtsZ family protein [Methanoregula sp.]